MKQNTIKVKEPAIFFRENSAEPEKRLHENLSKMQGQTQRGIKETLNKQQQNPFPWMDISFSQQEGLMYFTDQNFAKTPLLLKHNDEHQNPNK